MDIKEIVNIIDDLEKEEIKTAYIQEREIDKAGFIRVLVVFEDGSNLPMKFCNVVPSDEEIIEKALQIMNRKPTKEEVLEQLQEAKRIIEEKITQLTEVKDDKDKDKEELGK